MHRRPSACTALDRLGAPHLNDAVPNLLRNMVAGLLDEAEHDIHIPRVHGHILLGQDGNLQHLLRKSMSHRTPASTHARPYKLFADGIVRLLEEAQQLLHDGFHRVFVAERV